MRQEALSLLPIWLGFWAVGFLPGEVVCVFLPIHLDGFLLHLPLPTCDGAWVGWGAFASFRSPGLPGLAGVRAWAACLPAAGFFLDHNQLSLLHGCASLNVVGARLGFRLLSSLPFGNLFFGFDVLVPGFLFYGRLCGLTGFFPYGGAQVLLFPPLGGDSRILGICLWCLWEVLDLYPLVWLSLGSTAAPGDLQEYSSRTGAGLLRGICS